MNLDYLHSFLGLVRFMNYTKAANYLHISQSTLSKHVSMLEFSLKTELVARKGRGISLTAAGAYLAESGPKILRFVEDIEQNLVQIKNEESSYLIISTTSDASADVFSVINRFQSIYSKTDIIIKRDVMRDVVMAVFDGSADIGITTNYMFEATVCDLDPKRVDFGKYTLEKKPLYLVVPEDDPLAKEEIVDLNDVPSDMPVVVADSIMEYIGNRSPNTMQKLEKIDCRQSPGNDLISWENMVVQVRLHQYYVISPCPNVSNGCARLRLKDEGFDYDLVMLWRKDNENKALRPFIRNMEQRIRDAIHQS